MPIKWQEISLDNIHIWPKMAYFLISLIVFMILMVLGYRFDTKFQLNTLHANLQKQNVALATIQKNQTRLQPIDALLSHIDTLEKHQQAQIQKMPTIGSLPRVLDLFYTTGKPLGLIFHTLKPAPYIKQADYTILPSHIVASGHYHNIVEWLTSIVNSQHSMMIKDFDIVLADPQKNDSINPLLTITLNIDITLNEKIKS